MKRSGSSRKTKRPYWALPKHYFLKENPYTKLWVGFVGATEEELNLLPLYRKFSLQRSGNPIKKSSYHRDNRLILSESPNWRERLAPRCWLRASSKCRSLLSRFVQPLKPYMSWVQTGVSQVSFYLLQDSTNSTKGP